MRIKSRYVPRSHFMAYHLRRERWAMLVAHRRAGKTVAALNDVIEKASYNTRPSPQYAYIAPMLKQAKAIAWKYLKHYAAPYAPKINESELWVELGALPNSPRIYLFGADNPDAFRGMYFDGVVLDEYGNMSEVIYKEVLLPALLDRKGWCTFMGTPNGPNHFRDQFYRAKKDSAYHISFLPVTITHIISDEDLAEMRRLMDPEQYAQEMLCNFEASVRGAIYARQMEQMQENERISPIYTLQPRLPTHIIADLGFRDAFAMGFAQERPDGLVMGHSYSNTLQPIDHYIDYMVKYLRNHGLVMGKVCLPHDAKAKSLQTGKSIVEIFKKRGIRPTLVPNLSLKDGIAATRKNFDRWYFCEDETEDLVLALKSYHRKYDDELKVYSDEPVHDWSSHYADMFRYANLIMNPRDLPNYRPRGFSTYEGDDIRPAAYGFALNDIWNTAPRQSRRMQ